MPSAPRRPAYVPLRHYHRKLDAGFVALPQMTGRRFGMPFILSPPTLTLRFRQNNGPTPSGDYQPSRSLSMAGSECERIYLNEYDSIGALQEDINDYIDFYNHRRFHETLDYKKPMKVTASLATATLSP